MKKENVLTTVNVSYKDFWDDKKFAEIIKNFIPPVSERLFVLFTEVSLQDILKWAIKENIPLKVIKKYYYKFVVPFGYRNEELEKFFKNSINELNE